MSTHYNEEMHLSLNKLYPSLGAKAVEATPEHWNAFTFNMSTEDENVSLWIESDENHNDETGLTQDILDIATEILRTYDSYDVPFNKAMFKVWQESGKWKFSFEHVDA